MQYPSAARPEIVAGRAYRNDLGNTEAPRVPAGAEEHGSATPVGHKTAGGLPVLPVILGDLRLAAFVFLVGMTDSRGLPKTSVSHKTTGGPPVFYR
jgi:hypothetical protein